MMTPTLLLWLYAVAQGVVLGLASGGDGIPQKAELASSVALSLVMATWVLSDAHQRGRRLCYDYDSFVYFAWPLVLPVYLFQTRRWRALFTLLWFVALCVVATLVAGLVSVLRN